jgi:predicted peroxiredoxin
MPAGRRRSRRRPYFVSTTSKAGMLRPKETPMPDDSKVVINLTTGHEDADTVTVAFLIATAALAKEKRVVMFLSKEAVRIGLPGYALAIETAGAPPVSKLFEQFSEGGGELYVCPICFDARKLDGEGLVANAKLAGATPLWEFIGDDAATVFSY